MKICLVLISDGWGGAENVVYNLSKKLKEKVNVVILLNSEIVKYFSNLENVKIFQMSSLFDIKSLITSILLKGTRHERKSRWNFGFFYFLNELLRYLYYKRICKDILRILIQQKVDIVHLHLENSLKLFLPLLKELDVPIVFTFHGVRIFDKFRPFERMMVAKGLTRVNKITCVSKYLGKVLENSNIPVSNKPVILYNGVNVDEIRENPPLRTPLNGEFKLLFPGGAKLWKGGDLLIESLPNIKREIPKVHLYVAGAVPKKHTLRKLVEKRKLEQNVTFMGFLTSQDYYQVLSSIDVLVFPSKNEAFPMVLLEAMAVGKPIVTTRVGGIPEVIKDMHNGILVKRDPKRIADAVVCLYRNKDLYKKISQNNLKCIRLYDWNNIINEYIELYKTLVG